MNVRCRVAAGALTVLAPAAAFAVDCSVSSGLTMPTGAGSFGLGGGLAASFLQDVADRWNDACATGTGGRFPAMQVGSGELAVTINFFDQARDDVGTKNGCEETVINLGSNDVVTGATINVWAQKRDGTGCGASLEDLIVHGLGHVLGLNDVPDPACDGTVMGRPVPGTPMMIHQDHCDQADENWTTEVEEDPCQNPDQSTICECDPYANCSPIILDLDRNGLHLTGLDDPVHFDIDADGLVEIVSWTSPAERDGLLALDRNGDGLISDGGELFGDATLLSDGSEAPHGFIALAELDLMSWGGNGDGAIDADDAMFAGLRVWIDHDHDGSSDSGELVPLAQAGVVRIGLDYVENRRRDGHGNRMRYNGKAWIEPAQGKAEMPIACSDVFFQVTDD